MRYKNIKISVSKLGNDSSAGKTCAKTNVYYSTISWNVLFINSCIQFAHSIWKIIELEMFRKVNITENFQKDWLQPENRHQQFLFD